MLLGDEPQFPQDFDPLFGYNPEYKGLGVFLYRSDTRGEWYVVSIQNKGLRKFAGSMSLDTFINPKSSCKIDMMDGERGGIRIKILLDYIYIYKKDANGGLSYDKCVVNQIRDPYFHHLAVISSNQ